jgi:hypothetical protein
MRPHAHRQRLLAIAPLSAITVLSALAAAGCTREPPTLPPPVSVSVRASNTPSIVRDPTRIPGTFPLGVTPSTDAATTP